MKFTVSSDSCCDGFKSGLRKQGVSVYPMLFCRDGEVWTDTFSAPNEYLPFYAEQAKGKRFTTAGLNSEEMRDYFVGLILKERKDVLHIALSSGLSMTCGRTMDAAMRVNEALTYDASLGRLIKKWPYKVYVVDSLSASIGQMQYVRNALAYGKRGLTAEETAALIEDEKKRSFTAFFTDELETLEKGGRIPESIAGLGDRPLDRIMPVLSFDGEGKLTVLAGADGAERALTVLAERFAECWDGKSEIYLCCGVQTELCGRLYDSAARVAPKEKIRKLMIGPVVGAHTGSGIVGLSFLKKL